MDETDRDVQILDDHPQQLSWDHLHYYFTQPHALKYPLRFTHGPTSTHGTSVLSCGRCALPCNHGQCILMSDNHPECCCHHVPSANNAVQHILDCHTCRRYEGPHWRNYSIDDHSGNERSDSRPGGLEASARAGGHNLPTEYRRSKATRVQCLWFTGRLAI